MITQLERDIVQELKKTLRNSKFRLKDLLEWSSAPVTPREGEIAVDVVVLGTTWHCCVPAGTDKRTPGK